MINDSSGDQFALIARTLSNEPSVTETLDTAIETSVSIVGGCDYAAISLVGKRRDVTTVASTDDIAVLAAQLQYDVGQGPILEGISEQETVYSADLLTEKRWPHWASRSADELGIRSVLALQLFVGEDSLGSLNLYSTQTEAFPIDDRVSALALAAHVAVAMTSAQDHQGMESALAHRTVIGQAEGILMQAFGIPADRAFAALVRISQTSNTKLYLVATDLVRNGIRPELFD